jgi:hypothetical protein
MSVLPVESPDKEPCPVCGSEKVPTAPICPQCKLPPKTKPCKVCKRRIPNDADYCNECNSNQKFRFVPRSLLALSLLTTFIAVVTPAIAAWNWLEHADSHTSARLINAYGTNISVYLWNTGRNPSAVIDVHLRYFGVGLRDTELIPAVPLTRLIEANGHSIVDLTVLQPKSNQLSRLQNAHARLCIAIQESDGKQDLSVELPTRFVDEVLARAKREQS